MLCSDRPQILTAEAEGSGDLRAVWRDATRLLKGESVAALRDGARLRDGSLPSREKDPRVRRAPPCGPPRAARREPPAGSPDRGR